MRPIVSLTGAVRESPSGRFCSTASTRSSTTFLNSTKGSDFSKNNRTYFHQTGFVISNSFVNLTNRGFCSTLTYAKPGGGVPVPFLSVPSVQLCSHRSLSLSTRNHSSQPEKVSLRSKILPAIKKAPSKMRQSYRNFKSDID